MQFKTYLYRKLPFFVALSLLFGVASCGSYQYAGYDSDGIYGSESPMTPVYYEEIPSNNSSYYKEYFGQKSQEFGYIAQDDNVIFTNIDDYQGSYTDEHGEIQYQDGYAGWGQQSDGIDVNIYYNNLGWYPYGRYGFYSPYRHWGYFGWGYSSFYNPFYPFGFYNYGYAGYYPYYGYSYYPYYYGNRYPHYYGSYYGNYYGNVSYTNSRRGGVYSSTNRTGSTLNYPSATNRTTTDGGRRSAISTSSRPSNVSRPSNTTINRRSSNSSARPSTNTNINRGTRPTTRSNNSSGSPAVRRSSGTTSRTGGGQISAPSRSSSPSYSAPSRSSSSPVVRSSSSAPSRSSAPARSSGGSSRRGGN